MKQLAILLIAALFVGCVSTPKQDTAGDSASISKHNWQRLQAVLQDAPVELRLAITQAAEERLGNSDSATSPHTTEPQAPQAVLLDILTHSSNQTLLPDSAFEHLNNVVIGENRQPRQSYATALADYLTQSDFVCQQPLYAGYFQRRYPTHRAANPCADIVPFAVLTQYDGAKIVWLDPKRVKSIHLLFAGKSQSLASRFGHVALRLVICPEGKATEPECDANLFEHVVLGFQAHIDEFSLNTLKALKGKYKAYLFANPFMDVYQQYAINEFREVYSLPLRLDDAQRELMVRELADIHWRYAGEYSFFTRNCATMMQNALRVAWPEFGVNDQVAGDYLRPDSLFEAIKSSSLAEGDKLASLDVAEREGYFFSSTRPFYEQAFSDVRNAMQHPDFTGFESYLQINPIERRQARSADQKYAARLATDQHLREAQIMLEEYAILHSERLLMIEGAKYFEQQNFLGRADSILAQLDAGQAKVFDDCLLTPIRQHVSPIQRVNGIPNQSSAPEISNPLSECQSPQGKTLLRDSITKINDEKSEQWLRLKAISQYWAESIANVSLLKSM
jgi:hypothetical protein